MPSGVMLVFGGTTEARELLGHGLPAVCSVATDYGAQLLEGLDGVEVIVGRLDESRMAGLISEKNALCVVDATHPFATQVSANIRRACESTSTPLRRLLRAATEFGEGVIEVSSCAEAAEAIEKMEGNVLLTVGSKELNAFTSVTDYRRRLYARVLSSSESVLKCEELGFDAEHIIAMKGPFSQRMNEEIMKSIAAEVIVTKNSGPAGGTEEKIVAALALGKKAVVVARPVEEGYSAREVLEWARAYLGI